MSAAKGVRRAKNEPAAWPCTRARARDRSTTQRDRGAQHERKHKRSTTLRTGAFDVVDDDRLDGEARVVLDFPRADHRQDVRDALLDEVVAVLGRLNAAHEQLVADLDRQIVLSLARCPRQARARAPAKRQRREKNEHRTDDDQTRSRAAVCAFAAPPHRCAARLDQCAAVSSFGRDCGARRASTENKNRAERESERERERQRSAASERARNATARNERNSGRRIDDRSAARSSIRPSCGTDTNHSNFVLFFGVHESDDATATIAATASVASDACAWRLAEAISWQPL